MKTKPRLPYPTRQQIRAIGELLSKPANWIKTCEAGVMDETGYSPTTFDNPAANCFDFLGAIARVMGMEAAEELALWVVRVVCPGYIKVSHAKHPFGILADWNDHDRTTFVDIQGAIKKMVADVKLRAA